MAKHLHFQAIALTALFALAAASAATAQTTEQRLDEIEQRLNQLGAQSAYMPKLHGILRGKYEYQPDLDAGRFEVRNARLSVEGALPLSSSYKLEVDLCDESAIKMKDAWVRIMPVSTLRVSIGQQRMPFSIDAHRNPSAQFFANRSFIAKQVGDMRDVGVLVGYDFLNSANKRVLAVDAGIFNGSNLDNQKTAWHSDWNYSARLQWFPIKGLAIVPSVQHQAIANRTVHYTSLDLGAYYQFSGFHLEAEYLHKSYSNNAFSDCHAINAMAIYKQTLQRGYLQSISYLLRFDKMGKHSSGKDGFSQENPSVLAVTDDARNRFTAGITLSVRNKYFPTDLRFNYEKYHYRHNSTPKESEQDKLVVELMIRF
ncbi:MAG: porin [Muribaculaceae bacterium]